MDRIQNQMKNAVEGSHKLQSENERIGGKLNEIVEKYQDREAVSDLISVFSIFKGEIFQNIR